MAGGTPTRYKKTQAPPLASYDFQDLASGVGFKKFYGAVTTSGGNVYVLTPNLIYSDNPILSSGSILLSTASLLLQEYNFDTSAFNAPRTLKGTMTCLIPWGVKGHAGATSTDTINHTIKIMRLDGTTEEILASAQAKTITYNPVDSQTKTFMDAVSFDIPQSDIKYNQKIRMSVEQRGNSALAANGQRTIFIGADPQGRLYTPKEPNLNFSSGTFDTSAMQFDIPFKIGL